MDILGFPMKPQKSPDQGAAAQPSAGKPDSGSPAAAGQPAVSQAAPKKVQNKKRVSLLGVHFSGTEGPMLFSDIEEFEIISRKDASIWRTASTFRSGTAGSSTARGQRRAVMTHQRGSSGTSSLSEFLISLPVSSPTALPYILPTIRICPTAGFSGDSNTGMSILTAARPMGLLLLCKALSHAKAAGGGALLAAE